ncbi:hypothetical protein HXX76_005353 [Chlamydomonas incerta]|uniref:Guanylate cyclase domain-containing protein n=1 Tax=Chlamydomonas incerta TaxID=51695 RepID=A0A835T848_CHLIN|nr:hypothetical protein HXX76_005353 [Chlamydomonas incerta]|eukprot:KAG2438812.1 hypothetical protein HXX76_005353 [Chlamydomonas incerta]
MRLGARVLLCILAALHINYVTAEDIAANASAVAVPAAGDVFVDAPCVWRAERSIALGCGLGDEGRLRAETAALVHACVNFADDPVLRRLRVIAGVARLYPELQRLSTQFSASTGIPTYFNFSSVIGGSITRIRAAVARPPPIVDTADTSGGVDAIIANPSLMPDVDQAGKLLDLSPLVATDGQLRWYEINSALREQMVVYGNKVVGIPVTTSPVFLFYHKPVFARDNLTVPVTWDQVLALAERYNGTDLNGDGVPDYGMCMTPSACFVDGTILTWVLGSFVQTRGASQGLFIDPETMSNLANTSALTAGLDVLRRLRRVGPRAGNCAVFEDEAYLEGRCLLSITTPTTFKAAYSPEKPARFAAMRGRMGMAPFPGSTRVLDRASGNLTDCDAARCPMARVITNDTSGVPRPVNQPTPSANVVVLINAQSTAKYQFYAYSLFSYLLSSQVLGTGPGGLMTDPRLETMPMRDIDLTADAAAAWVQAGYAAADVDAFFTAYRLALSNRNQNFEQKFPGNSNITTAAAIWTSVVTNASAPFLPPLSLAVGRIALTVAGVMAERGGPEAFAPAYRKTLSWQPPATQPPPAAAPAVNTEPESGSNTVTVAVAVAVPCGIALLAAVGIAVWAKRRLRHGSRGSIADAVKPPGAGPDTTLLVTDIQSSTSLWEHLDAGVMDRALSTHHAVMRKAIADWAGYESATEGDSFIVAFRSATEALMCALAAQQALLDAAWPQELLDAGPGRVPGLEAPELDPLAQVGAVLLSRKLAGTSSKSMRTTQLHASLPGPAGGLVGGGGSGPPRGLYSAASPLPRSLLSAGLLLRGGARRVSNKGSSNASPMLQPAASTEAVVPEDLGTERDVKPIANGPNMEGFGEDEDGEEDEELRVWDWSRNADGAPATVPDAAHSAGMKRPAAPQPVRGRTVSAGGSVSESSTQLVAAMSAGVASTGPGGIVRVSSGSRAGAFDKSLLQLISPSNASGASGPKTAMASAAAAATAGQLEPITPSESNQWDNRTATSGLEGDGWQTPAMSLLNKLRASVHLVYGREAPGGGAPGTDAIKRTFTSATNASLRDGGLPVATAGAPKAVTLFTGLRVRMGLHTGLPSKSDVSVNAASGRTQYSGEPLRWAKQVSDTAHGGMVMFGEATRQRLDADAMRAARPYVLYSGLHVVGKEAPTAAEIHLYTAYCSALLPRALVVRPLVTAAELRPGVLAAPVGHSIVVQVRVVGLDSLLSWNRDLTAEALRRLLKFACGLLPNTSAVGGVGGYVAVGGAGLLPPSAGGPGGSAAAAAAAAAAGPKGVGSGVAAAAAAAAGGAAGGSSGGGKLVIVFTDADAAVAWAAAVQRGLTSLEWPDGLLEHELCDEVWAPAPQGARAGYGYRAAPSAAGDRSAPAQALSPTHGTRASPPAAPTDALGLGRVSLASSSRRTGGSASHVAAGAPPDGAPTSSRSRIAAAVAAAVLTAGPEVPAFEPSPGSIAASARGMAPELGARERVSLFGGPADSSLAGRGGGGGTQETAFDDAATVTSVGASEAPLRLLYRGLRLRAAVACGPLKGGLVAGDVSGHVVYRGKAFTQLAKLMAKAKTGQIVATADLARTLPPFLAEELTIVDRL